MMNRRGFLVLLASTAIPAPAWAAPSPRSRILEFDIEIYTKILDQPVPMAPEWQAHYLAKLAVARDLLAHPERNRSRIDIPPTPDWLDQWNQTSVDDKDVFASET